MRLSTLNSFKTRMAGAGSMRFLAFNLFLAAILVAIGVMLGLTFKGHQASAQTTTVTIASEALHITVADGTKSIGQLIREQSTGTPLPAKPIASFHFLVDPFSHPLIFPRVEGFQPPGFQWAILPSQDKKFNIPRLPLLASEALDYYFVRSTGNCSFLLYMEFYP
jgi:hypothetical protein